MSSLRTRIGREGKTLAAMVRIYCRAHHPACPEASVDGGAPGRGRAGQALCPECQGLLDYALGRLDACPFGEGKPTCLKCPVHCYRKEMREKIREVMRYAGPRMAYRHPVLTVFHFLDGRREPDQ